MKRLYPFLNPKWPFFKRAVICAEFYKIKTNLQVLFGTYNLFKQTKTKYTGDHPLNRLV